MRGRRQQPCEGVRLAYQLGVYLDLERACRVPQFEGKSVRKSPVCRRVYVNGNRLMKQVGVGGSDAEYERGLPCLCPQ